MTGQATSNGAAGAIVPAPAGGPRGMANGAVTRGDAGGDVCRRCSSLVTAASRCFSCSFSASSAPGSPEPGGAAADGEDGVEVEVDPEVEAADAESTSSFGLLRGAPADGTADALGGGEVKAACGVAATVGALAVVIPARGADEEPGGADGAALAGDLGVFLPADS